MSTFHAVCVLVLSSVAASFRSGLVQDICCRLSNRSETGSGCAAAVARFDPKTLRVTVVEPRVAADDGRGPTAVAIARMVRRATRESPATVFRSTPSPTAVRDVVLQVIPTAAVNASTTLSARSALTRADGVRAVVLIRHQTSRTSGAPAASRCCRGGSGGRCSGVRPTRFRRR